MSRNSLRSIITTLPRAALVVGAAGLALSACDQPRELVAPETGSRSSVLAQAEPGSPGQQLARALALGMRDPAVRVQVRNALRDSRKNEHKLVLQEFVQTRAGQRLVDAAAAAAGVDRAVVAGWIGQLPAMDFYVPLREHRRAWRGSDDVVVGLNLDVDDPRLAGYAPDGTMVRLDVRAGAPSQTVLILHPAEPKWDRPAGDGAPGAETIESSAGSPAMNVGNEFSRIEESCIDGCASGGWTSGGTSTSPLLVKYKAYIGDGWGDNEIMFKHYTFDSWGNQVKVWEWIHSGYSENEWATPNKSTVIGSRLIKVWERDSGWPEQSNDDFLGEKSMASSGTSTYLSTACGPLYSDDIRLWNGSTWQQACGADGTTQGDHIAWFREVLTIEVVYQY